MYNKEDLRKKKKVFAAEKKEPDDTKRKKHVCLCHQAKALLKEGRLFDSRKKREDFFLLHSLGRRLYIYSFFIIIIRQTSRIIERLFFVCVCEIILCCWDPRWRR